LAVGSIIGKGGSGISQMEQKHKGVSIFVYRASNCFCLRGPKRVVDECRGAIILKVASASVSQPIELCPREYDILKNSADVVRSIQDETNVQVSFSESLLKIKGTAGNISDAQGLFEELLQGNYRAALSFEVALMEQIQQCVNRNLFDFISSETKCTMEIDTKQFNVTISGKRSGVKKAKALLMDKLTSSMPDNWIRIQVPKPLVTVMNDGMKLASISAKSGSLISFDIDTCYIIIQSTSTLKNTVAVELIQSLIIDSQRLIFMVKLEQDDSWIISLMNWDELAGNIKSVTQCVLQPYHEDLMISITGLDEDSVKRARKILDDHIDRIRIENIVMDIPEEAMSAFLGRKNANMNALARDHGVSIERLKKNSDRVRLQGENVLSAMIAVKDWIQAWEVKNMNDPSASMKKLETVSDNKRPASVTENVQQHPRLEVLASNPAVCDSSTTPFEMVVSRGGPAPDLVVASTSVSSQPRSLDEIIGSVISDGGNGKGFSGLSTRADVDYPTSYIPSSTTISNKVLATNKVFKTTTTSEEIKVNKPPTTSGSQSLFDLLRSGATIRGNDPSHAENRQKTINGATYYMSSSGIAVRI